MLKRYPIPVFTATPFTVFSMYNQSTNPLINSQKRNVAYIHNGQYLVIRQCNDICSKKGRTGDNVNWNYAGTQILYVVSHT